MKFLVEFGIEPGTKNRVLEAFEERGPSRNPGVTFRGAWIGKQANVVYVLAEAAEEAPITQAAKWWSPSSDFKITEVVDIEQF